MFHLNLPNLKNHLNLMYQKYLKSEMLLKFPQNLKNHLNLMYLKYR
jgi:hypothetical protein